jgi:hypothetical protein
MAESLEAAQFGILCLTRDNFTAPWVLFEAGALGKFVSESAVCPYLLDLDYKDISGPLTQFQAKKAEKASTLELLESINNFSSQPMPRERLAHLFEALWPNLAAAIKSIPSAAETRKVARSSSEVLEDLVESVRALERRLSSIEGQLWKNRVTRDTVDTSPEEGHIECPGCFELVDCCHRICPTCGRNLEC